MYNTHTNFIRYFIKWSDIVSVITIMYNLDNSEQAIQAKRKCLAIIKA